MQQLPVVPITYYPPLATLIDQSTREMPAAYQHMYLGLLLRWDVVTAMAGFQDWDLGAVKALVDTLITGEYMGLDLECQWVPGAWEEVVDGETIAHGQSLQIQPPDGYPLNLTRLWCQIDPATRRYLGVPESVEEESDDSSEVVVHRPPGLRPVSETSSDGESDSELAPPPRPRRGRGRPSMESSSSD